MNSECYRQNPLNLVKAVTVFFVTVVVCTFFLIRLDDVERSATTPAIQAAEQALSQLLDVPEAPLELLDFSEEPLCVPPEKQWALIDSRCVETAPVIPDRLGPKKKIPYQGIIVQAAWRYQVDPYLIRAIIFAESGYNPRAKSKKGARGLMQLMPSTAKSLGVQDIFDPVQNIDGGVRYFRTLLDRFDGDVQLALAAYNAGSRHVRNYEGIPPFKATRYYIKKVLRFQKKFKLETASLPRRLA